MKMKRQIISADDTRFTEKISLKQVKAVYGRLFIIFSRLHFLR